MYSLKDHIQEKPLMEARTTNVHLDHIEDTILDDGLAGAHIALNFIESIAKSLAGHSNKTIDVTTKWDGSPAIVAGINPENGRFFIGTKAVFSKRNPKIVYTKDDIKKYYKDSPGLQRQLEQALEYLPKLGIDGVIQGDMMFGKNEVREQTIDGEKYVTFKPNTIMYAVPFDSDLAEQIRRAKMGIVFHTSYSGDSLRSMTPSYAMNVHNLKDSESVWFDDASYKDETGTVTFTEDEFEGLIRHLNAAEDSLKDLNPIRFEQFLTSKALIGMIKMYTNAEIRGGKQISKGFLTGLSKFVEDRINDEKIRDETKEKKKTQYAGLLKRLESTLSNVFEFQYYINEAKLKIINKLQQIESVGTFVSDGKGGYKATKQEGFVAVDHLTNKAIKLVDRLEFSRMNQLRHQR